VQKLDGGLVVNCLDIKSVVRVHPTNPLDSISKFPKSLQSRSSKMLLQLQKQDHLEFQIQGFFGGIRNSGESSSEGNL